VTQNELLLYNLLATASTLVYRSARVLSGKANEKEALECDIEQWFSEAKKTLSAASFSETQKAIATSVDHAAKYGGPWTSPPKGDTTASPGPANATETPSTEAAPSSNPSSGGISPPAAALRKHSPTSPSLHWFMK